MKRNLLGVLCLLAWSAAPGFAQAANPEDEPIDDAPPPVAPAPVSPVPAPVAPVVPAPKPAPAPPATAPATPNAARDFVPRAEFEALKARQAETQRQLEELRALIRQGAGTGTGNGAGTTAPAPAPSGLPPFEVPPPLDTPDPFGAGGTSSQTGSGRSLLLPDISLNTTAKGLYSSDRRDEDRRRLSLTEAELAIQGFVYPNVRAEAFIVSEPGEDVPFGVEQGFLDFLGLRSGLTMRVGRDFTPFGRTGRQHPHQWLYSRQLLPRRNLIGGEALGGDGVSFSYLLPTRGNLYANATFGIYNGLESSEISSNPFGDDLPLGTAAGFNSRFYLGRLQLARPVGSEGELELGASYARGRSSLDDDTGTNLGTGRANLYGLDVSYRQFFTGNKRLLLRSEYFANAPGGALPTSRASGYYGLANLRLNRFKDIGLLYESSGYPQAPGAREKALSLIYTKQFTEQFYVRFQGTHGDRPFGGGYNEGTIQFTWGLGPHTHNLE